jgi:L-fucose mutarotase/ribose pyranase (RbsD/FucU family)
VLAYGFVEVAKVKSFALATGLCQYYLLWLQLTPTAGHHAKILIADANYPASTKLGPNAEIVYLNLAPGILSVAQVLKTILAVHPVEEAVIMGPLRDDPAIAGYPPDWEPPVWADYRKVFSESDQHQEMKIINKWKPRITSLPSRPAKRKCMPISASLPACEKSKRNDS